MIEKLIKKNLIHKGKVLDFYCDEVKLPNGKTATREYLNHPGAAAVLPFIDKNNIVLVKQYRYVAGQITYEIPAGKMDEGETPIECAQRELEEETGLKAKRLEKLISFYPSTAFSNEVLHIFAAFGVKKGKVNPDEDEFVEKIIVNFKDALEMTRSGAIIDSKTIIALLMFDNILK
ncbi:NUDIX domain-containing protein [Endomicrobium proavitum]|uniref:GDP-mannose pyrophosphatase n=1 Tax=Endomicrobium proavitum TaxID=1408281 RepID=A0A0G3WKK5_9BACT|nr:NUDIX hydrolase [Endomicrobium proavitum]AKL97984.1 ADP-ribose pyrophosphatase [Endomicrobium proavitum]